MKYPHTITVKEIPVPPKTIQVVITTDYGTHDTNHEFYAEPEEFLKFWQPLVQYYERVKNEQASSNS
jgi:hypothetical protein